MPEASAPGSSANLGPGFDTLALALELRCRVEAKTAEAWTINHVGAHRTERGDAVLDAARRAVGDGSCLALTVRNEIPIGRGLGSSAAAAAAGAAAAWAAVGHIASPAEIFALTAAIDGHPDNAAASVYGGLVSVTTDNAVLHLTLHETLKPVLAVPDATLATSEAREVLSDSIGRGLGVRSLQRVVALVEGLRTADARTLAGAAGDELHETPRAHLNPLAQRLIRSSRDAGAVHACWSGAGPSVMALAGAAELPSVVAAMQVELGGAGVVLLPEVAIDGVRVQR